MKDRLAAVLVVVLWLPSCGQSGAERGGGAPGTTGAVAGQAPGTAGPATLSGEPPERRSPLLMPDERRVSLVVLPGDAAVEVEGLPVRRRNGLIDLTGKVGQVVRVRVRKRDKSTDDRMVTIKETGASPQVIDLNEPAVAGSAGKVGPKPKALGYED